MAQTTDEFVKEFIDRNSPRVNDARAYFAQQFYDEVCAEAEANMLKTGKLEGSHFAAMQVVLKRWKDKAEEG